MGDPVQRRLVFVVGTRAQLIKVAPIVVACEKIALPACLLLTGQHHETMQDLIDEFGIRSPQIDAMPSKERATVRSLLRWLPSAYFGIRRQLRTIGNGAGIDVLVHGDTLSTVIGAIAGWRHGARVVHLESGLTSNRLFDPFPEEICRRVVFRLADMAMCPNPQAAEYMRIRHRATVVDTAGNTIVDAVTLSGASPGNRDSAQPYLVASLHRFQNLYNATRLRELVELVLDVSKSLPVHFVLHPATRARLVREGLLETLAAAPRVRLSPRLGYGEFLRLVAASACVLTDGGSNQEELAELGVPTIVMRERTERPDGLGENAIMEPDVVGGVREFIASGNYETLRRDVAASLRRVSPSAAIVDALRHVPVSHSG
jgi:UDP-N-acetylglucosamine 2-epimerase (non-hydrolysing)